MQSEHVSQVRRFNRLVTQRIGALDDHYLGRDRSLGESRLLFEIGPGGRDLRDLRARLGLDSGYLSRLIRSLTDRGLVEVRPLPEDKRVRRAELTPAGLAEHAELDRLSDAGTVAILPAPAGSGAGRLPVVVRPSIGLFAPEGTIGAGAQAGPLRTDRRRASDNGRRPRPRRKRRRNVMPRAGIWGSGGTRAGGRGQRPQSA